MTKLANWLKTSEQALSGQSTSARFDAEYLACFVLEKNRAFLFAHPEYDFSAAQSDTLQQLLTRRLEGEPIAYLTGRQGFWSLDLKVTPATLIPRPETECLVEQALSLIETITAPKILDLGTGSGAIALALAVERPDSLVTAIDQSQAALDCAKVNAESHQLTNVRFLQSSWFEHLPATARFDLIVSNPPYIDGQAVELSLGDLRFEPKSALVSDDRGYRDLLHIIEQAPAFLTPDGLLMLEHGNAQQQRLLDALTDAGYREVFGCQDLAQHPRFLHAKRPSMADLG